MLIKFRVENYRSICTEQVLEMTAGPVRTHPDQVVDFGDVRVLSAAMVFGANASGKSNLVKAIADSSRFITQGVPIGHNQYCRTSEGADGRPTGFEFTFRDGDDVYAYGYEVMLRDGTVTREWLNKLTPNNSKSIFTREGSEIISDFKFNSDDSKAFYVYSNEVKNSSNLFLRALTRSTYAADSVLSEAVRVMEWFRKKLIVLFPESRRSQETGSDLGLLRRMMTAYGTGVTEVGFERVEEGPFRFDGDLRPLGPKGVVNILYNNELYRVRLVDGSNEMDKVVFRHGMASFDFVDESDGTRRLFDLAPLIDPDNSDDVTYIIDELDRSLHPQLTRRFVKDFLKVAASHRRQLIATVHESRLMDLNLIRRDELWLVQMTSDGTELYSIEDFNERGDRRVDRAYMEGRYGGVPCFRSLFPDLEEGDETD